jgi:hypothetical protein
MGCHCYRAGNLIDRETQEVIELSNLITIEVLTVNFCTVRGRTTVTQSVALMVTAPASRVTSDSQYPNVEASSTGGLHTLLS